MFGTIAVKMRIFSCILFFVSLCAVLNAWAGKKTVTKDPALEEEGIYWYEGKIKKKAWRSMN